MNLWTCKKCGEGNHDARAKCRGCGTSRVVTAMAGSYQEGFEAGKAEERQRTAALMADWERLRGELVETAERHERQRLLNTPEFRSFADAVVLEALHQRERWSTDHDAGKTDADWHWLLGWLSGKAVHNPVDPGEDPVEKRLHRIITVAAAAANWHAQVLGQSNMRPGIDPPPAAQEGTRP